MTPSWPPGWYPSPGGEPGQRYWDGYAWTEHRAVALIRPAYHSSRAPFIISALAFPIGIIVLFISWHQFATPVGVALNTSGTITIACGTVLTPRDMGDLPDCQALLSAQEGKATTTLVVGIVFIVVAIVAFLIGDRPEASGSPWSA
jgi:uncharacterized protein DUF2510